MVSGLHAAKTLQSLGYETLVIEATDRIGENKGASSAGIELGAEEHYQCKVIIQFDAMIVQFAKKFMFSLIKAPAHIQWMMDRGLVDGGVALNPVPNDSDVTGRGNFRLVLYS